MDSEQPTPEDHTEAPRHPREIPTIDELRSEFTGGVPEGEPIVPESADEAVELLGGLMTEEHEIKHALARDFHLYFPAPDEVEERRRKPRTEQPNFDNPDAIFSGRTKRPKWEAYFPVPDSAESQRRYERFRAALPEPMQFNLEALRGLHQEKSALLENPTFAAAYKAKETEEVSLLRDVGIIRRAEQLRRGVKQERVMMLATARSHGRRRTKAEQG